MKRAVIYARVSSEGQADAGLSVDSQIESCHAKARALEASVVQVFRDDGVSGRSANRPGFKAALAWCQATSPDFLIVWSSSRFMRNVLEAAQHKHLLAGLRTKVVYASQDIDLWTDEGWLADSIQQIFDEQTSRQISKDTRRSMITAARDGHFMGGRVPFGYQAVQAGDGKRRRLQPLDAEAQLVREIFASSARGAGAVAIALALNAQGRTHRGRPWAKNSILYLLKNEVYMGHVVFGRFDRRRKVKRQAEDVVRVPSHPPLVPEDQWQQVQQALGQRRPELDRPPGNAEHTFAGLLRCGHCQASLMLTNGTGRGGKVYYYYACRADLQGQRCQFKRLPADAFDRWMLGELLDRVLTPENVRGAVEKLDTAATDWVKDRDRRRRAMVQEMRDAEGRRSKLFSILETQGSGAPGITEMAPRLRELNTQIQRLELALVALEDEQVPLAGALRVQPDQAAQAMRRAVEQCDSPKALRAFVASIVKQIDVDAKEVRVEYHPECLIQDAGGVVHSTRKWLPVPGLLRTATLVISRPGHRQLRAA